MGEDNLKEINSVQEVPYELVKPDDKFESLYRRRGVVVPFLGVTSDQYFDMLPDLFSRFPFVDKYKYSVTAEQYDRPMPFAFKPDSRMHSIADIYEKYYPVLLEKVKRNLVITEQTVERRSRIGAPSFEHKPDGTEKRDYLIKIFDKIISGDIPSDIFGPTITNVRLQNEDVAKKRTNWYLKTDSDNNQSFSLDDKVIDQRYLFDHKSFKIYASRPRLVFNYGTASAFLQLIENIINEFYGSYPVFHHNMQAMPYDSSTAIYESDEEDIPHYERILGLIVKTRSKFIGGIHDEFTTKLLDAPLICVDNRRHTFQVKIRDNFTLQLGSGLSAVSTAGKELNLIIKAYCVSTIYQIPFEKALDIIMNQDPALGFIFALFGDDTKGVYKKGDSKFLKVIELSRELLGSVPEDPPKFLGYKRINILSGGFINRLSMESAFLNYFMPERPPGSTFRKFAAYGFFERRKLFRSFGEPGITDYLVKEKDFHIKYDLWEPLLTKARSQKKYLGSKMIPVNHILGKDYLLTKQERLNLGYDTLIDQKYVRSAVALTNLRKFN